jgi:hypothetical protein
MIVEKVRVDMPKFYWPVFLVSCLSNFIPGEFSLHHTLAPITPCSGECKGSVNACVVP